MATHDELVDSLNGSGWRQRELGGFCGLIGPLWTRKEEAGWAYAVLATDNHVNPAGLVHGGLIAALMDHALSAIAWEKLGRRPCVTVQLDTHFLSAARAGQFLEGRGRVVRATSSLVFMQGAITIGGAEIAVASALLKAVSTERPIAA